MGTGERPNILFVFPDQWRGDCLQHLGHPAVQTPNLTDLASNGVTFTRAYSPCPSCIAARAALITGQRPTTTGRIGYRDGVPWNYTDTLMHRLRNGGYQTINVGKTHFYPQRAHLGYEINDLYDTQRLDAGFISDYELWLRDKSGGQIVDTTVDMSSNSWIVQPWVHPEHLHPSAWTSTRAIEHLERRDPQRPFFLTLNYHRPHPPIDPPLSWFQRFEHCPLPPVPVGDWAADADVPVRDVQPYRGRLPQAIHDRTRRGYFAQLAHLDFQIGRVLWWLSKHRQLHRTLVVFSSDHGELLGDHHLWRKSNGFEGAARVPLIIRLPSMLKDVPRSATDDRIVSLIDLLPTICQEAGVEIPAAAEGASLSPALRGQAGPWRDYIHGEHARPGGAWQFVTDGREKFIWNSGSGREWFFDLTTDPQELRNRLDDPTLVDRVSLWRQRLIDELAGRTEDRMVRDGALNPGQVLPDVRPALLAASPPSG